MPGQPLILADLLRAVGERRRRIALVIGAGSSVEPPTGLRLASDYSRDVHRRLVLDGLLEEEECGTPDDLSVLATTVWEKHGQQSAVVHSLPRAEFRLARPNDGHLIAAALLREGAIGAVLTLNFDLAMSSALMEVSATEVDVVPGPAANSDLGQVALIYLHRNVDELDFEKWILRTDVLQTDWEGGWEEVVAQRVMASPVVIFVGLGSPAVVLTETIRRIRGAMETDQHRAYVVDPANTTPFSGALDLSDAAHVQSGWCDFMRTLAERVVSEFSATLREVCERLCEENGWTHEVEHVQDLCQRLHSIDLVALGRLRAAWLLDSQSYVIDDNRRALLGDLLLAIGLVERAVGCEATFCDDGMVELRRDGAPVGSVLAASGNGTLRWAALEARVLQALERLPKGRRPKGALLGGLQGPPVAQVAAPEDVLLGDLSSDITQGEPRAELVTIEEIRDDPVAIQRLVA